MIGPIGRRKPLKETDEYSGEGVGGGPLSDDSRGKESWGERKRRAGWIRPL